MDWRGSVYRKKVKGYDMVEWKEISEKVYTRDLYTCQRCFKKYRSKGHISAHHIVPRVDGGSDELSNLITLCHKCHDYVEVNRLKNVAAIIGSYDVPGINFTKKEAKEEKEGVREETFTRPEWHKYVYGGVKKNI